MSSLPILHYVKNLKLIERNKAWWLADGVETKSKLSYYGSILKSYAGGANKIDYLGKPLYFDNPATPLNMQIYPYEITKKILSNMDFRPKTVLDIGANIGQFSLTMNHVLDGKVKIDSFEPNPFVFEILKKNVEGSESINIYNFGLGDKTGTQKIHFNPTRTGIGSMIKENAGLNADMSADVAITSSPESVTGQLEYDLVKIDVEGYEYHAIRALAKIKTHYLFVEFSGSGRGKDYLHSEMFNLIRKQWGDFDIHYIGSYEKKADTFDILIKFVDKKEHGDAKN